MNHKTPFFEKKKIELSNNSNDRHDRHDTKTQREA